MDDYCYISLYRNGGGGSQTGSDWIAKFPPDHRPGRTDIGFKNDSITSYSTYGPGCMQATFIGHQNGNHDGDGQYLLPSKPAGTSVPGRNDSITDITALRHKKQGINDDTYVIDVPIEGGVTFSHSGRDANEKVTIPRPGTSSVDGEPCPGAQRADYYRPTKRRCTYGFDADTIRSLYEETKNLHTTDPRKQVFNKIQKEFCDIPDNYNQAVRDVDTGVLRCTDVVVEGDILKEYCEQGDNIKTKSDCWNNSLSGRDQIARTYCEDHPDDTWCGCLNVKLLGSSGCNLAENKELPGCKDINAILDKLDPTNKAYLQSTPHCWASACATAVQGDESQYKPSGLYDGCPNNITVCGVNVNIGGSAIGSTFDLPQQCSSGDVDPVDPTPADPADPDDPTPADPADPDDPTPADPDRPFYKTSDNFDIKNTDTWTDDDKKIVGGGGLTAVTSCVSSVLLLLLVI